MSQNSQPASPENQEALTLLSTFLSTHSTKRSAGEALGVSGNELSRWQRDRHIPQHWRERLKVLMDKPTGDSALQFNIDKIREKFPKCPPDFLELAARAGSVNKATDEAGMDAPSGYKIARGVPPTELRQSQIAKTLARLRNEPVAQLQPGRHYGISASSTEGMPELLAELIRKQGNMASAARAIGYRTYSVLKSIQNGTHEFTEELQERVKKALAGQATPLPPPIARSISNSHDDPDTGEMGIAIVVCEQKMVEPIYDAGEAMGGNWVFRLRLSSGEWVIICRIEDEGLLRTFKSVVRLIADKVVTP